VHGLLSLPPLATQLIACAGSPCRTISIPPTAASAIGHQERHDGADDLIDPVAREAARSGVLNVVTAFM